VKSKVSVGALRKVVVRADGSGLGSDWLLDSVVVSGGDLPGAVEFECGEWLTSAKPSAELLPGKRVGYRVAVVTGSESGSGTNSNVFVTLVGEGGESGEVALLKSEEHVDKFESGHTDTFVVKSKVSVGALRKVVVRADGSGLGSDWLLDSVVVSGDEFSSPVLFSGPIRFTSQLFRFELFPQVPSQGLVRTPFVNVCSPSVKPELSASVSSFQSVFLLPENTRNSFDLADSQSYSDIIKSLTVAIQSLNSAAELLKSQLVSVRTVVDSQFRDVGLSASPSMQSSLSALCFKEKSLSQQLSAIIGERAALREQHVRFSKLNLESTHAPSGSLKRHPQSKQSSPSRPSAPPTFQLQDTHATFRPLFENQATRDAVETAPVASVKPRLFQATTLSINQRNLVPYLLEALSHGNPEQQLRAMEIVCSISDCPSNQNFLVDCGFAQTIALLGVKAFSPSVIKALVTLLRFNVDAVQTARSQGVADVVARIMTSLSGDVFASLPEIAELKAIFG
jgi:hypothetical protein